MANQRLKGQDVEVRLVRDSQVAKSITAIKDFEVTLKFDILQEGMLGETTDRYDEIFRGCRGSMTIQWESAAVFDLFFAIRDRAVKRTPGTRINVQGTFNFPNGDRPRISLPDVKFGDIPMGTNSREAYSSTKLEFACGDAQRL